MNAKHHLHIRDGFIVADGIINVHRHTAVDEASCSCYRLYDHSLEIDIDNALVTLLNRNWSWNLVLHITD
jgi:hypothetical protein